MTQPDTTIGANSHRACLWATSVVPSIVPSIVMGEQQILNINKLQAVKCVLVHTIFLSNGIIYKAHNKIRSEKVLHVEGTF